MGSKETKLVINVDGDTSEGAHIVVEETTTGRRYTISGPLAHALEKLIFDTAPVE